METNMTSPTASTRARAGATIVLATLCAGQFLMALDTSVMNVSIANVANDINSDVTGIQTAITLYTLVMASAMITGGKLGEVWGRKRAFTIGAIVYGAGSLTTALAPNLAVLLLGWSVLEGLGAALMLPAIVALVATNFEKADRPRTYGLLGAAAAIAVAVGPIIGGLCTTYLSWRYVFAGEVIGVLLIVGLARKMRDAPPTPTRIDWTGAGLSAAGLALIVYATLRSGTWGFLFPKGDTAAWFGLAPTIWLLLGGVAVLVLFAAWEQRLQRNNKPALIDLALLRVHQLRSGLVVFFFQFLAQMGLFFVVPLYLSVALGLNAVETGLRIVPLSVGLLGAALLVPRLAPHVSPRRAVRLGFAALLVGIVSLMALLEVGAGPGIVLVPLLFAGIGMGTLASQLGGVTVGAVDESKAGQVGGLQNTVTNLGASVGTALAGAILIASLTSTFLGGLADNPAVPDALTQQATVSLSAGVPFVSDAQLQTGLDNAGVAPDVAQAIVDTNTAARINALRAALAVLALLTLVGIGATGGIPTQAFQSQPSVKQ